MIAGAVSPATRFLTLGRLHLESGLELPEVRVAYREWGPPAEEAVLVCHALTGSADVDAWWAGLFGPGRCLDPGRERIVCSNVLGSCYGTTGPTSGGPAGGSWGGAFPGITVRDMVAVQARLLGTLGVRRVSLVVGGSLGGMQALEWAASCPEIVERAAVIAAPARHPAWAIALSELQRQAIRLDPAFRDGGYGTTPPTEGLALARMIAMCSYRSPGGLAARFDRERRGGSFEVEGYLRHHGEKLVARFDANTYLRLADAMDSHDVGRGRGGTAAALAAIRAPVLVVGIDSDVLYPPAELEALASGLPNGRLAWLRSPHGHDAFLMETESLDGIVRGFRGSRYAA